MRKKFFSRLKYFIKITQVLGEKKKSNQEEIVELKSPEKLKRKVHRGIQRWIWVDRQKNQWTWRQNSWNYWRTERKNVEEKWTEPKGYNQEIKMYSVGISEGKERQKRQKSYLKE